MTITNVLDAIADKLTNSVVRSRNIRAALKRLLAVNLVGLRGPAGPAGKDGNEGPQGPPGIQGPVGPSGGTMNQSNTLIVLMRNDPTHLTLDLDSYVPADVHNVLFLVQANNPSIGFTGNVGFSTRSLILKTIPTGVILTLRDPLGALTPWGGQTVQFLYNGASANISGGNTFTRVVLWFNGLMYDMPAEAGAPPVGNQSVLDARVLEISGSAALKYGY
jgi:hypothetical protein